MDYKLGFLSDYIAAVELAGKEPTLTIASVVLEKVESLKNDGDGPGKVKDRWIARFKESKGERGWLVNRTNAESIRAMWGNDVKQWVGHKITLFTTPVRVGPKMELGIRVKGSPELKEPLRFELKLPRKKPVWVTLLPTGNGHKPPLDEPPPPDDEFVRDMEEAEQAGAE